LYQEKSGNPADELLSKSERKSVLRVHPSMETCNFDNFKCD
jgi:hypothetical protein